MSGSSSVPDNVELRENVAYREGNEKWKIDLMLPKNRKGELCQLLFLFMVEDGNGDKASECFETILLSMPLVGTCVLPLTIGW